MYKSNAQKQQQNKDYEKEYTGHSLRKKVKPWKQEQQAKRKHRWLPDAA